MSSWQRAVRALLGDPAADRFIPARPALALSNEPAYRLEEAARVLRAAIDAAPEHISALDAQGRIILVNSAWINAPLDAQCPLHQVRLDANYLALCMLAQQDEAIQLDDPAAALRRVLDGQIPNWETEYRLRIGQRERFFRLRAQACETGLARAILTHLEITQEKEQEQRLRLSALVYENSGEAMMISDASNSIIAINPAFTRLTGYTASQVLGKNPKLLSSGRQDGSFYRQMWDALHKFGSWQGEIWNRRADGREYAEWLTIRLLRDVDGNVYRYVAMFSDITERKQSRDLLWQQANYDSVTGLPNRQLFHDRLSMEVRKAVRAGSSLALFMIDLDNFKDINDALGHSAGDQLLTAVGRRICASVREADTVARLGGDEFTVILTEVEDRGVLDRVAQAILSTLSQPFDLDGETLFLSASIGIAMCPDDASDSEGLLQDADQALYVAKGEGRARFRYFRGRTHEEALAKLRLVADLRAALPSGQFQLYFQPIVDLASGEVHKAEALLRWLHPQRGYISPAEFIPAAEDAGMIGSIGDWVLAEATRWARAWKAQLGTPFQVSIHKSPSELNQLGRMAEWNHALAIWGRDPDCLLLEITEGVLLSESTEVKARLAELRKLGVQIALDDFGTGYSSMAYLNRFHVDYLKIDKSFIVDMATNSGHRAVTEAIIVMAHKLGMKVVAEGVETEEQRRLLAAAGCDYGQGYLFSPALPPEEFESRVITPFARQAGEDQRSA